MTGETINQPQALLEVTPDKLEGIEASLGPEGHGAFIVRQVMTEESLDLVLDEVFDPSSVRMRSAHDRYYNQRGLQIVQNHTVYALKLLQGDPAYVERVPKMHQLAGEIESLTRSLSYAFPTLDDWTADEMSLHRYDDPEVGLSFHKDNLRFPGVVVVATIEGESDFCIRGEDGTIHTQEVGPGDLAFMRSTELFTSDKDIRAEHAVLNLHTAYRTAFIVRANSRPDEALKGFHYANWDMLPVTNPYSYLATHSKT